MAAFQYRLQQVFELRERKKKEQEQRVIQARRHVREVEQAIQQKKDEIRSVRDHMLKSPHTMMASHDEYLYVLNQELDKLYQDLDAAKQQLAYEQQMLQKAQADVEALLKHKDKALEEWQEEQKRIEMKQLDEVASQRFFRAQQAALDEETEDLNNLLNSLE
ncbi:MAG: flagellar export protein FliJ [Candidatus Melainabacteria bacterium]